MTAGTSAAATAPAADDDGYTSPAPAVLASILAGDLTTLLEIDAYPLGVSVIDFAGAGTYAAGSIPAGDETGFGTYAFVTNTFRFSDRGFVSDITDTPAVTQWIPRLGQQPNGAELVTQRTVSIAPESYADGDQSGIALLLNGDGGLDDPINNNAVDARRVRILVGPPTGKYSDFTPVFDGVSTQWYQSSATQVRLDYADNSYLLDVPIQTNSYGGTGTYDGTTNLKGYLKPLLYGEQLNITPVSLDPSNLIYQVHDGTIASVFNVYDKGVGLTYQADTTNLYAGSTTSGSYRTDISRGLFQLGAQPAGQVTADVQGDADSALGGYVNTIGMIIVRGLLQRTRLDRTYLQLTSFASFDFDVPGIAGCYIPASQSNPNSSTASYTGRQFLDDRVRGVGGYWFFLRNRQLKVQVLKDPSITESGLNITASMCVDVSGAPGVQEMQMPTTLYPPTYSRRVNCQENNTVQTGTDVAGAVTPARLQFLLDQWRIAANTNTAIQIQYLRARNPDPINSDLQNTADAQVVADRLQALHGATRQMFQVVLKSIGLTIEMGQVVKLTYPRYGLSGGRSFRAFPISEDYMARTVTLVLWG